MTEPETPPDDGTASRISWQIHDIVVGTLAGGFAGFVVWLMLVARMIDSAAVGWAFVMAGAGAGVGVLRRERRSRGDVGPYTIALWGVLVFAMVWVGTLIWALGSFT